MRAWMGVLAVLMLTAASFEQSPAAKPLAIYVVDLASENATLFVAPSGESVLIDTGNGGAAGDTLSIRGPATFRPALPVISFAPLHAALIR